MILKQDRVTVAGRAIVFLVVSTGISRAAEATSKVVAVVESSPEVAATAGVVDKLLRLTDSTNAFFLLTGAVMILAMHGGFAFLEVGSVRKKNQVNALNKILCEWSFSTLAYLFIGYPLARGIDFLVSAEEIAAGNGASPIRFFLYLGFAACIPAIISGGVAERSKFWTNAFAGIVFVAIVYPLIESVTWGRFNGMLASSSGWLARTFDAPFHDFAGSVVVHATGGWLALPAIYLLGARLKRYETNYIKVSSIPFLALGSWILIVGWFGFNVMSAGAINELSGLVAINSLMAMVGGTLTALFISKNDAGFVHNGALAGLVAVCAGSDLYHPISALVVGSVAGGIFVWLFQAETERWKIDDVLGVWPLHGVCGAWGGIAVGIFGNTFIGGMGGTAGVAKVSFLSQLLVTGAVVCFALVCSALVYGVMKYTIGIRLDDHEEQIGADLAVHQIEANPEDAF